MPLLRPVILFTAVTSTIGGLQIFTESQVLLGDTAAARAASGMTIVLVPVPEAFINNQFGYGAAIGWALFILIVLFSIINWRLIGGSDDDGSADAPPAGPRRRHRKAEQARCALNEPGNVDQPRGADVRRACSRSSRSTGWW